MEDKKNLWQRRWKYANKHVQCLLMQHLAESEWMTDCGLDGPVIQVRTLKLKQLHGMLTAELRGRRMTLEEVQLEVLVREKKC